MVDSTQKARQRLISLNNDLTIRQDRRLQFKKSSAIKTLSVLQAQKINLQPMPKTGNISQNIGGSMILAIQKRMLFITKPLNYFLISEIFFSINISFKQIDICHFLFVGLKLRKITMIKFIFRIILILVLVYLFGGLAFSVLGKAFGWLSNFFYWVGGWLDKIGFEPLIKLGGN